MVLKNNQSMQVSLGTLSANRRLKKMSSSPGPIAKTDLNAAVLKVEPVWPTGMTQSGPGTWLKISTLAGNTCPLILMRTNAKLRKADLASWQPVHEPGTEAGARVVDSQQSTAIGLWNSEFTNTGSFAPSTDGQLNVFILLAWFRTPAKTEITTHTQLR